MEIAFIDFSNYNYILNSAVKLKKKIASIPCKCWDTGCLNMLSCSYFLKDIKIFHSNRGNEYDNISIDNILGAFDI